MCNCSDLKYAKRTHGHNYAKQQDIDTAMAMLQEDIAAAAATLQAAIDALMTTHANDVATLQAAIDALMTTHANDVATLQGEIDDLTQALIDCDCLDSPEPCVGFAEEFPDSASINVFDSSANDWNKEFAPTPKALRLIRDTAEIDDSCDGYMDINTVYRDGMTIEVLMKNDVNIDDVGVYIYVNGSGVANGVYFIAGLGTFDDSRLVSDVVPSIQDGDEISNISFQVNANLPAPEFTRWLLYHVRLVCP